MEAEPEATLQQSVKCGGLLKLHVSHISTELFIFSNKNMQKVIFKNLEDETEGAWISSGIPVSSHCPNASMLG